MDSITLQRRFPVAYGEGVIAKLKGIDIDKNPHTRPCSPVVRNEFNAWQAGWVDSHPYDGVRND